jgi:dihydrofolate synthase/folylpolyglutamate synthase
MGNPHQKFKSIHIAGTNGKGSTAAIIDFILRRSGYKTGLFTSPHLVDFRERIKVRGKVIPRTKVVQFVNEQRGYIDKMGISFFEASTALAFQHFAQERVDIAVVETGMGGRLDATNVLSSEVSVITNLSLEHTQYLGSTLAKIAGEKAAIVKRGVPTVSGVTERESLKVIEERCRQLSSPLLLLGREAESQVEEVSSSGTKFSLQTQSNHYKDLWLNLLGSHQVSNGSLAIMAVEELAERGWRIEESGIREGMRGVDWPGRFQIWSQRPLLILDVAHNQGGTEVLAKALREIFPQRKKVILFGVMEDKDYPQMIRNFEEVTSYFVFTRPQTDRAAVPPHILAQKLKRKGYQIREDIPGALDFALASLPPDGLLCVTGSHYTVGEAIVYLTSQNI